MDKQFNLYPLISKLNIPVSSRCTLDTDYVHAPTLEKVLARWEAEMKQQANWMNVNQIAMHMGVSKETIYRLLKREVIPASRVGKLWRFDPLAVDKAIAKGLLECTK